MKNVASWNNLALAKSKNPPGIKVVPEGWAVTAQPFGTTLPGMK